MYDNQDTAQVRTLSAINVILGIWLLIAPHALGVDTTRAMWNATILGIIVIVFGLVRLIAPSQSWASWVNGLAGLWLIIAPFALGYQSAAAYWNHIIVGILVAILAFANFAGERSHTGHGHPAA